MLPPPSPSSQEEKRVCYNPVMGKEGQPLPILQVSLGITADQSIQRIKQIPQSDLIRRLYQSSHSGGTDAGGSFDRYAMNIKEGLGLTETDLDRIIGKQQTNNLDEEEFMRVWQVRSALTRFAWTVIGKSTMPDDVKVPFSTAEEHLFGEEFESALRDVTRWADENAEQDTPIALTSDEEQQVRPIYDSVGELLTFYNLKKPLIPVYQVNNDDWSKQARGTREKEIERAWIIGNFFDLFAPEERANAFREQIGYSGD